MDNSVSPDRQLLDRLDALPLSRMHVLTVFLCALAFGFDLMEIALGSALVAVFSAPPHAIPSRELSWLLSSVYVGAILGAPSMGWLADRYGRLRVLSGLLVVLAVTSALAVVSRDVTELTIARGLSGLALGAFPSLMVVYLTDLLPARRRGLIFGVCALAFLGAPVGIFLIRALTPYQPLGLDAWRWSFVFGGAGAALLSVALWRWVPESPRWLLARGHREAALEVIRLLEQSRPVLAPLPPEEPQQQSIPTASLRGRRGFLLLAGLYFLAAWSTVAFPLLSGAVLVEKGYQLSDALLAVGLTTFGPVVGNLLAVVMADRVERRTGLALCALLMLAVGLAFVTSDSGVMLVVTSTVVSLLAAIYVPMLNIYGAESSAAVQRGAAVSGAWAFNRLGAALAPLLLLPLLRESGALSMYAVIAATLGVSLALLFIAPAGHARRAVA